ncbi:MAG: PilZ domain-containing protein [Myxococcota bacterium]|jgi:c-di-GMP-binding flagellar brake protein YcgR|nr:PilZ domain-containing protein [Myxococcota bacterium]
MQGERRQHFRVVPEAGYPIAVDITGDNFLETLEAADISEGGLSIIVKSRFEDCRIDKSVTVVVRIPSPVRHEFAVTARIRHVVGERFGVQFLDLKEASRLKIDAYISHRLRNQSWFMKLKYKLGIA